MPQLKGRRVAIVGAGPGGVSAALAMLRLGYEVQLFERYSAPKPLGGAVLLSVPVLAVLRHYGIGLENFGGKTLVEFHNNKGKLRARIPWNSKVEEAFGIEGWHYGVLRRSVFGKCSTSCRKGLSIQVGRSHTTRRATMA